MKVMVVVKMIRTMLEPHNHSYSCCVPVMVVMKMIKVILDVVQGSFMST